jgi:hypothetical protein
MLSCSARACVGTAVLFGTINVIAALPVAALTMKECSAKYKAEQAAGTVGGMTWLAFRKANCGANASATPGAAAPAAIPATTTNAMFPNAISPKYSKESAGKARMHTCLDQYKANKTDNRNAGLRWIEKGGGYYSECNKRLKG